MFILCYDYLVIRVIQGKMSLIQAGFLAYFSQLLLGTTFRIWYPMWLIPFAALGLNSRTFWRTFLFSITVELSILMYLIVWRWGLKTWSWGVERSFETLLEYRDVDDDPDGPVGIWHTRSGARPAKMERSGLLRSFSLDIVKKTLRRRLE